MQLCDPFNLCRYSDSGRMSAEHLRRFQQECQKEELLDEECQQLIKAFEPRQGQKTLSLEGERTKQRTFAVLISS